MKKTAVSIFFILIILFGKAQQVGMYNHYFYKPLLYNPAFTGIDDAPNVMLINRAQWDGFKGSPQLNLFTLDGKLTNKKIGLGLGLMSDTKGINKRTGGNLFYSYRVDIKDDAHLSFGISFGIINQSLDYAKAAVENTTDPLLFSNAQQKITYDANAGIALISNGLEIGAAIPQILGNKINYVDSTKVRSSYTQERHYMASLKYKFPISKDKGISVTPGGLVRFIPNTPLQYDGNINFSWNDKFWVGLTYKNDYAIAANLGLCIHKQLYVGYSYDVITSDISGYSGLSHEIMVNLKFGKNKKEAPDTVEYKPDFSAVENRLDSMQKALQESQAKVNEGLAKINESQIKIKESQNKINENQRKINELNSKIEEQAKVQQQIAATPPVQIVEPAISTPASTPITNEQKKAPEKTNFIPEPALGDSPQIYEEPVKIVTKKAPEKIIAPVPVPKKPTPPVQTTNAAPSEIWISTKKVVEFKDEAGHFPQTGYYIVVGSFRNKDLALAEVARLNKTGYKTANWVYYKRSDFTYVFILKLSDKKEAMKKAKEAKASGIENLWIQRLVD